MTLTRIALLAAATAAFASAEEWTKSFQIAERPELRIDTNDASVEVRRGAASRIDIRVVSTGWTLHGRDSVRIVDRQVGDRVELEVKLPSLNWHIGSRSMRIEVTAPARLTADVRTGDGRIYVDGITGALRLNTGDGSIDADRVEGSLDATTGDGRIVARGRFDVVRVRTGDGSVDVEARTGSKVTAPWRLETGDGSIRLAAPSDLAADFDVHTGDGSISSDLKLAVSGVVKGHDLRGRMNGGGLPVTVRTGDGSIRLARY
jgi:DUF4097 and DUF4098 domain-containing protein YvlB